MAALRYAARRIAGQPPQAIFRALVSPAVAEERRRLLPRVIQGGSPAVRTYSRPFSFQRGNANPSTTKAKIEAGIEVLENWTDLFVRSVKLSVKYGAAVGVIGLACSELSSPRNLAHKTAFLVKTYQDKVQLHEAEVKHLRSRSGNQKAAKPVDVESQ